MTGCWFYMLRCADGSYYVGTSRSDDLETRISQHDQGLFGGYTAKRRPVELVYSAHFERITDAIAYERQVKGWSRAKKEALIKGDFDGRLRCAPESRETASTFGGNTALILRSSRRLRLEGGSRGHGRRLVLRDGSLTQSSSG